MSTYEDKEKKEEVYEGENRDFEGFEILEKGSQISTEEVYISSFLKMWVDELETTSKSKWRNAIVESLTGEKGPDYAAALVACINYRSSWHFNDKKTKAVEQIFGLLQELEKVRPHVFGSQKIRAMDDEAFEKEFA